MDVAKVKCLLDVAGLQKVCQQENVRFSHETNKHLVYETLQKLGPAAAQRLVSKCKLKNTFFQVYKILYFHSNLCVFENLSF